MAEMSSELSEESKLRCKSTLYERRTSSDSLSRAITGSTSVRKRRCTYNFRMLKRKGVILVLVWNFLVFSYQALVLGTLVKLIPGIEKFPWRIVAANMVLQSAVPFLIYPIAGWIADAKIGRYKVIRGSLWLIWIGALLFLGVKIVSYSIRYVIPISNAQRIGESPALVLLFTLIYVLNAIGIAGFQANFIPFGVDQMEDGSSEQYSAFIHWYYWTRNSSIGLIVTLLIQSSKGYCEKKEMENSYENEPINRYDLIILLLQVGCVTLAVCLDLVFSNQVLNKDPKVHNPLKKVWTVSKFIIQNDTFVGYRKAITYSYDSPVQRSDFAKRMYGGPFDSDHVEDVKTFWKMLVFIFSLGLGGVFLNDAVYQSIKLFVDHLELPASAYHSLLECSIRHSISVLVYPTVFTLFIPFYEIVIHPIFSKYVPRMMVRMTAGIICMLLSAIGMLVIDVVGHAHVTNNQTCMMFHTHSEPHAATHLHISMIYVVPLTVLMALGEMLTFISALEFILAQSPFGMRGLLIGMFYAMNGVFDLLAGLVLLTVSLSFKSNPFTLRGGMSCGSWYYATTVVLGLLGVVIFFLGAIWYKKRQRGGHRTLINHQTIIESYYEASSEQQY